MVYHPLSSTCFDRLEVFYLLERCLYHVVPQLVMRSSV